MFLTGVSNLNDLNQNLEALNNESWGSWDVELVSVESVKEWMLQNQSRIKEWAHDGGISRSLYFLAKRVKEEPYVRPEAADDFFQLMNCMFPFPFNDLPEDVIKCIMNNLSDTDLRILGQANLKILKVAGEIGLIRVEIGLQGLFKRIEPSECQFEGLGEGRILFEEHKKFVSGTQARREALRNAFIPLCNGFRIDQFLDDHPDIYADRRLLELMFRKQPAYSCLLGGSEKCHKYTLAFLDALKRGDVEPGKLELHIYKKIGSQLESAFVEAIARNASIGEITFHVCDADITSDGFTNMLISIRDNPFIETIKFCANKENVKVIENLIYIIFDVWEVEQCNYYQIHVRFKKIGSYVNRILELDGPLSKNESFLSVNERKCFSDFQFENCFSERKKHDFRELVRSAKNAPGKERKNELNKAIHRLFEDPSDGETHIPALLLLLCKYDEYLFSEIADELPADFFDDYFEKL